MSALLNLGMSVNCRYHVIASSLLWFVQQKLGEGAGNVTLPKKLFHTASDRKLGGGGLAHGKLEAT